MSLNSALSAGISGLTAQATKLATVADNIANVSTTAYKSSAAQFRTLVNGGEVTGSYSAGGVVAVPVTHVSQQGVLQATSSNTDLALDGDGFFVVRGSADPAAEASYTRAGSFTPDLHGNLRNAAGLYLQGWPTDAKGGFTNTGSVEALKPIKLDGIAGTATPTTEVQLRANLSAAATVSTTYTPGALSNGTVPSELGRSVDISDAQGGQHRLKLAFVKSAPNSWAMEAYVEPATDVSAAGGMLVSGTLAFNPDGTLNRAASSPSLFAPITPVWTNGAGSAPLKLALGTDGKSDGLSQYGSPSTLLSSNVDGGSVGNLASVQVAANGLISAVFENGSVRPIYQLPIATFSDPDNLIRQQGNAFGVSSASGVPNLNAAGTGGSARIAASSLEGSTVDLASELADMIRTQRAYSAASKIVLTADEMLQEATNLKR